MVENGGNWLEMFGKGNTTALNDWLIMAKNYRKQLEMAFELMGIAGIRRTWLEMAQNVECQCHLQSYVAAEIA